MTTRTAPRVHDLAASRAVARSAGGPWSRELIGAVTGLTCVALGVRLAGLASSGVRMDELFTWWIASMEVHEGLAALVAIDTHPPLHYLVAHAWLAFGDGTAWLRLPSALAGAAAIPVVCALGRRLRGERAGLLAAALVALSPWHVLHSQDGRGYTLLALALTVGLLGALRHLDGVPGRWWFAIGGVVAVWTHATAVVTVGALAVAVAAWTRGAQRRRWLTATVLPALAWLAWSPALVQQLGRVDHNLAWTSYEPLWGPLVVAPLSALLVGPTPTTLAVSLAVAVAVVIAVFAGRVLAVRDRRSGLVLLAWAALPLVEALLTPALPVQVARTLLPSSIPLAVLLASAMMAAGRRGVRVGGPVALASIALGATVAASAAPAATPWEDTARYLEASVGADDTVLYLFNFGEVAIDRLADVPGRHRGLPGDFDARREWDEPVRPRDLDRLTLPSQGTVWLVAAHPERLDPAGAVLPTLASRRPAIDCHRSGGVWTFRFDVGEARPAGRPDVCGWPLAVTLPTWRSGGGDWGATDDPVRVVPRRAQHRLPGGGRR